MRPTENSVGSPEMCYQNALAWLNEYGLGENLITVERFAPDEVKRLERAMENINDLWVKVRAGDSSLSWTVKKLIMDWFFDWRILIDDVRGLRN